MISPFHIPVTFPQEDRRASGPEFHVLIDEERPGRYLASKCPGIVDAAAVGFNDREVMFYDATGLFKLTIKACIGHIT